MPDYDSDYSYTKKCASVWDCCYFFCCYCCIMFRKHQREKHDEYY